MIITGGSEVVVRFDDPEAGQGTAGTLQIAPPSKVTIEAGPYRRKTGARPTRIRLEEGGIRLARLPDHRNPRVELATPGNVAIYGLTGTDAVLMLAEQGWVLALRDGLGDLTPNDERNPTLIFALPGAGPVIRGCSGRVCGVRAHPMDSRA